MNTLTRSISKITLPLLILMVICLSNFKASSAKNGSDEGQTYTDSKFGISFEYPIAWQLNIFEFGDEEHTGEDFRIIFIESEDKGELHILLEPNQNKHNLQEYIDSLTKNYFGPNVKRLAHTKVNGQETVIFGEPANGRTKPMLQAFIWLGENILKISFVGRDVDTSSEPFNQVLETLRFTNLSLDTEAQGEHTFDFPEMTVATSKWDLTAVSNTPQADPPANALICGTGSMYIPTSGDVGTPWNCINDGSVCPSYRSSHSSSYFRQPHRGIDIFGHGPVGTVPIYALYDGRAYHSGQSAIFIVFDAPYPTNSSGVTVRSAYFTHMARHIDDGYQDYRDVGHNTPVVGGVTQIGRQGTYGLPLRNMHLHVSLVTNTTGHEVPFAQTVDPTEFFGAKHMAYHSEYLGYPVDQSICLVQPQDDYSSNNPPTGHFPDVTPNNPFYRYIETLFHFGAVNGYSDGYFRPNNSLTRGAAAKVIILSIGKYLPYSDNVCPFPDVCSSHPFYEFIRRAKELGIVSGYSDGTYRPENPVTRAEYSKMVSIAIGTQTYSCQQIFPDVPCNHTFYQYIRHLYEIGAVSGYSNGYFYPDNNVTRGEASKIMVLATPHLTGLLPTFPDVLHDHLFFSYIENLADRGVVSGYSDGFFRPDNNTTRGEIAKMVTLGMGYAPNPSDYPTPTFPDVQSNHPFYAYIEFLAANGIVSGYGDGYFRPANFMTRGQIAKVITLALEVLGVTCDYNVPVSFSDVTPSNIFYSYIQCLEELGITNGYSDGTYRPDTEITRGQASKFVSVGLIQTSPMFSQESTNQLNNTLLTAPTYVPIDESNEGDSLFVLPSGDVDFAKLDLPQAIGLQFGGTGDSYQIWAAPAGTNADICVQVVDSNGLVVAAAHGQGTTGGTFLNWTPEDTTEEYAVKLWNTKSSAFQGVHTNLVVTSFSDFLFLPVVFRSGNQLNAIYASGNSDLTSEVNLYLASNTCVQSTTETNIALFKPTTASAGAQSANAVDGNHNTVWSAGDFAPQWIEINLLSPTTVNRIQLEVDQSPPGNTIHRVFVKRSGTGYELLHEFNGFTSNRDILTYTPSQPIEDVLFVKVETVQSPSWVAWYEIEVYSPIAP